MSKAHGYLPSQKEAVYFDKNYLLILAGAGTGKTTVLKGHAEYFSHQPMLYLCYNSSIQQSKNNIFGLINQLVSGFLGIQTHSLMRIVLVMQYHPKKMPEKVWV